VQLNQCDPGPCEPRTCLEAGAECGTIDDGCGDPLVCGTCTGGEICGAGGQPNTCAPPPAAWSKVSAGAYHTCAVKTDGTLWCWGRNSSGQLGLGTTGGTITTPQRVGVSFGWTEVAAGGFHTCGINYDHLYCWGDNQSNQLGDGTTTNAATPRLIDGLETWDRVSAGWATTCAHKGELYCWGNNDYQGLSADLGPVVTPLYSGDFYTEAAPGGGHACFRRNGVTGDSIACGGLNTSGQLGRNSTQSGPRGAVSTNGQSNWSRIFAGGSHSCAFAYVGTLMCWGSNEYGQLGNQTATEIIPDYVDGLSDWREIGLGDAHSCGVKANGNLYCWGINDAGQIGDGTTTNRNEPRLIGSMFASVVGGHSHTCAIDTMSRLFCWGSNTFGQLGSGAGSSSSPVAVAP
jgi:hypothetical protein